MAEQPKVFALDRGLGKYQVVDHYAILGVPLTAEPDQIRTKFLTLAKALHPDTFEGSDRDRTLATMFFARMISPAYQVLTNDRVRGEYFATLKLVIQNLKKREEPLGLTSEIAKKLQQSYHASFYPRSVAQASEDQYRTIDRILERTGDISELNLVYLMSQETIVPSNNAEIYPTTSSSPTAKIQRDLQLAELYIGKKQWGDALKELRAAEKKVPDSSILHQLMGVVYFNQNAFPMARSCFQKALKYDPKNQEAQRFIKEVDKKLATPKKEEKKAGWFGFGKK